MAKVVFRLSAQRFICLIKVINEVVRFYLLSLFSMISSFKGIKKLKTSPSVLLQWKSVSQQLIKYLILFIIFMIQWTIKLFSHWTIILQIFCIYLRCYCQFRWFCSKVLYLSSTKNNHLLSEKKNNRILCMFFKSMFFLYNLCTLMCSKPIRLQHSRFWRLSSEKCSKDIRCSCWSLRLKVMFRFLIQLALLQCSDRFFFNRKLM